MFVYVQILGPIAMEMQTIENLAKIFHVTSLWESFGLHLKQYNNTWMWIEEIFFDNDSYDNQQKSNLFGYSTKNFSQFIS